MASISLLEINITMTMINKDSSYLSGLYAITHHDQLSDEKLIDDVKRTLSQGTKILQYRDKSADQIKQQRQCLLLRALCDQYQCLLIINDNVELALHCKADGVHLGKTDTDFSQARLELGEKAIIGVSCYNQLQLALAAEKQGADYVAFGRFFSSLSKPDAKQANIELLQQAKQNINLPLVAIGGITSDNASGLLDAGADMLAVINGIFGQQDIAKATQQFTTLFK